MNSVPCHANILIVHVELVKDSPFNSLFYCLFIAITKQFGVELMVMYVTCTNAKKVSHIGLIPVVNN